ncbi:DUF1269 domain-containing protein [Nocardioides sp. CN2-186]|uniref:DUF1269 domain-containing protein n=1 Tax=Nocardioides tweenelious TaxID=3156607 RepID=UPI0032B5F12B
MPLGGGAVPSLTVWSYPTPLGVDAGELHLKRLVEQDALVVHDAIAVIWMPGAEEATVRHLHHDTTRAATKCAVLGGLIGTVLLVPVAGAAVGGAAAGAWTRLRGHAIDDDFVDELRERVVPGTSALFVLSSGARADAVAAFLATTEATLLHADLGTEVPDELRALLA